MPILPASELTKVEVLKTDTILDRLSGLGGLPKGYIIELWGEQNTGKSTLAIQSVAAAQKASLRCLWVDLERTFVPARAKALGVDLELLDVLKCASGEEYIDTLEEVVKAGTYGMIVIDSIGDLSSRIEMEKTAEQKSIGLQASLMTRFVRIIAPYIDLHKTIFIGVNHERMDLNGKLYTMGGKRWSEKKKLSIRLREKSGFFIKQGDKVVGKVIRAIVSKNHLAGTERLEIESNLVWEEGFSYAQDLLQDAIDRGVFERKGNTFYWPDGEKIGMIGALREKMKENSFAEKIKKALS